MQQSSSSGYGLRAGEGLGYSAAAQAAAQHQGLGPGVGAAGLVTGAAAMGGAGELGSSKNPVYMMQVGALDTHVRSTAA